MARYQQSIIIHRPVEDVFAYMDDVSRETEWQSQLVEADQSPAGPTVVGTRKRYVSNFLGKRLVNTYVVDVYEPNRRMVCRTTPDSVLNATTELLWEAVGSDTRLTMSLDGAASGPLRFVPAAMLEATFEKEVRTTLARLKERLES